MPIEEKIIITSNTKELDQAYSSLMKRIERSSKTAFAQASQDSKKYADEQIKGLNEIVRSLSKVSAESEKLGRIHSRALGENILFDRKFQQEQAKNEIAVGKLGKSLKATTKFFAGTLGATFQLAGGISALNGEFGNQGTTLGRISDKISTYSIALIGLGSALTQIKYLLPVINAGFLAGAGIMTTLAAGVTGVALAYGLMARNISRAIDAFKEGGILGVFTKTAFDSPDVGDPTKILSNDERFAKMSAEQLKRLAEVGWGAEMEPGTQKGKNDFYLAQMKGDRGGGTEKLEKVVEITNELIDSQKQLNDLLLKETTFTADQRNQLAYIKFLQEVAVLKSHISGLQLPKDLLKTSATIGGLDLVSGTRSAIEQDTTFIPGEKKQTPAQLRDTLLSTLSEAGSNLSNIVNTFGFNMDSTLVKTVDTFGQILSAIQSLLALIANIQAGVSIFKSLFGIVSGGAIGGASGASGAAGGSIPMINPAGNSIGGNNYFKIDMNTMAIIKDGMPNYLEYKGAIRV